MVQFHDANGYPKSQKVAIAPVPLAAPQRFPPQSNRMFSFFRPRRGTPPPKHSQDNIFRSACFETPQKTKRLSRRQAPNDAATDTAARFGATTAAKPAAKPSAGKPAWNPSSMSRFGERFLRGVIFIKRSRRPYHTKADDSPTYAAGYSAGQLSLTASEQTDEDTICSSHDTAQQEPEATAEANGTASRFSSAFSSIVAQSPSAVPSKAHLKHPTVTRRGFFHSLARRRRCMEKPVSTQLAVHSVHHSPHRHPKLPRSAPIIGPQKKSHLGRHTLVLDLDETLVHSSFVKIPNYSFVIPVEIEGRIHSIYVTKRPGVDIFLNSVSRYYEVVIFTASLAKYADPLLDILDPNGCCAWRLFRESCVIWNGQFVKDLSKLGRDLRKVVILDNSPASYVFQPGNAIPIETWIDDLEDSELYELIPLLEALRNVDDIPSVLWRTLQND